MTVRGAAELLVLCFSVKTSDSDRGKEVEIAMEPSQSQRRVSRNAPSHESVETNPSQSGVVLTRDEYCLQVLFSKPLAI